MIARIRGRVLEKQPTRLVVEVGGLGLEIHVPLSTAASVGGLGDEAILHTVLVVREDALLLYGFHTEDGRRLFLRLTSVSGIGPKIALNALSGPSPEELMAAIRRRDLATLTRLPGIGKKTAERMALELKDAADSWGEGDGGGEAGGAEGDAAAALISLGYPAASATKAARSAADRLGADADVEEILRVALAALGGGGR